MCSTGLTSCARRRPERAGQSPHSLEHHKQFRDTESLHLGPSGRSPVTRCDAQFTRCAPSQTVCDSQCDVTWTSRQDVLREEKDIFEVSQQAAATDLGQTALRQPVQPVEASTTSGQSASGQLTCGPELLWARPGEGGGGGEWRPGPEKRGRTQKKGGPWCKTRTHVSYQQISILTLNFNTSFGGNRTYVATLEYFTLTVFSFVFVERCFSCLAWVHRTLHVDGIY